MTAAAVAVTDSISVRVHWRHQRSARQLEIIEAALRIAEQSPCCSRQVPTTVRTPCLAVRPTNAA